MKIIFLDIDGVLNSVRSAVALGGYPTPNYDHVKNRERFDPVAVALMRQISRQNVKFVLSSTWRKYISVIMLEKVLNLPFIGETPVINSARRGDEIQKYIDDHPVIEKFCIVDDDSDMLESQLPFFVKTSNKEGLSFQNVEDICKILDVKLF
jgi:hypothetical protein